ncbi:MAG: rRNA maturation RNase YbeY [Dehalococcoidia bacterium]|nr:rRNA maturation RNase YbeY [Dehalococcoidia bacterium]
MKVSISKGRIDIEVQTPFKRSVTKKWLRQVVTAVLEAEKIENVELSLLIADDETVHRLNRTYRGMDKTTDVLSFALGEGLQTFAFVMPPDQPRQLGEVIISYPQTKRQASEQGHPVKRELALLVVHGVLHLLSYDHETDADAALMRPKEAALLSRLESLKVL